MKKSVSRWWVQCLLVLAVCLCVFSMPKPVLAAPTVGSSVQSTTAILNRIMNNTPGLNKITTTGTGVVVRGTANTAVGVGRGLTVAVPTTAEVAIGAGRLAGVAGRAIKWGSWVGVASVVIPWIIEETGWKTCPPPDFFCKPGPDIAADPTTGGYYGTAGDKTTVWAGTAQAACQKIFDKMNASQQSTAKPFTATYNSFADAWGCTGPTGNWATIYYSNATCPAGSFKKGKDCLKTGPDVPAGEDDLAGRIEGAITGKPDRVGTLFSAESSANLAVMGSADPVTVSATPVTLPPSTRTETITNPDGSTSNVKTETKVEVKPVIKGSTLGDTKVEYPVTTTTTTTTTNNVTNVTTTNTTVINNYGTESQQQDTPQVKPPVEPNQGPTAPGAPGAAQGELKIPDDYNREGTQQKILAKLEEAFGKITAEVPKGDDELKAIKDQNDKGVAAVDGITEGSMGLKGWFPSIPTATCVNPKVPSYFGDVREVPICDKVSIFQTFISAVVCVFAVFGCVREVQSALKA